MSTGSAMRWHAARLRREAERRQAKARHALALARHRAALRQARAAVTGYAVATGVSVVGVAGSAGLAEVCWAVAGVASGVETGLWTRKLLSRRRAAAPSVPQLPVAVPAPPPRGSAAWPALRRLETSVTAIRRVVPALPPGLVEVAAPAIRAARTAYDVGRLQAAQIAAAEAAIAIVPATDRPALRQVCDQLLAELDLAAAAVEHLLTSCTGLIGARSGYEAQGRLSAATADVLARTYGLGAAALTQGEAHGRQR